MSDPSAELQSNINAILKGNSALVALVGAKGVYDSVPEGTVTPYVSFGNVQILPMQGDFYDGAEVLFTLDVWSRGGKNFMECKNIGAAVQAALDQADITLPTHRVVDIRIDTTRYMRDPDGITRHGVLVFKALTEPSTD